MTNPFGQFAQNNQGQDQNNQAAQTQAQGNQFAAQNNQPAQDQGQNNQGQAQNNQAQGNQFAAQAQDQNNQAAAQFNNAQGTEAPRPAGNLADMFNNGANNTDGDKFSNDTGAAVLIKATNFVSQMSTSHGPTDAVEAEWIVLDGPNQGAKRSGLIFATVVVKSLHNGLQNGRPLTVGIIARGEAKNGKSAPYLLNEANEDQIGLAVQAAQAFNWA